MTLGLLVMKILPLKIDNIALTCSLLLRRVHEIKRMHLDSCTHGLFIT
jgi:hypothetical protein